MAITPETALREAVVAAREDASIAARKDIRLAIVPSPERSCAVTAIRKVTHPGSALSPRTCPRFNAATAMSMVMRAVDARSHVTVSCF